MAIRMRYYDEFDKNSVLYQKTKRKVRDLRAFYIHLICYLISIVALLVLLDLTFKPLLYWFFIITASWGLGVFLNAMKVFGFYPFLGKKWEKKKMKELIQKEKSDKKQ
ncbi:2TM domain-containing protein [Flavobacterium beibuense]|uniref:2TM domain-containing protein n=1 Tax=Flavobacterium beibuense TaxID=657326 RepID=UPI00101B7B9B|nr:2TM domain-containing protein [Flavobacterium beibuense]